MNRPQVFKQAIRAISFLFLLNTIALGQQSMGFLDLQVPAQKDVEASLKVAGRLATKEQLTADEMLQIYLAEKKIGRCVWGASERDAGLYGGMEVGIFPYYVGDFEIDTTVGRQCYLYVQSHRPRFRVLDDGWKGDRNFWEPNEYWLNEINKLYPGTPQAMEIQFDFDFNQFTRRFGMIVLAKGKTCQEYHDEIVTPHLKLYLEEYSKEEIDRWPSQCDSARNEFIRGRSKLIEKYNNAPFTRRLQEIDPTLIRSVY